MPTTPERKKQCPSIDELKAAIVAGLANASILCDNPRFDVAVQSTMRECVDAGLLKGTKAKALPAAKSAGEATGGFVKEIVGWEHLTAINAHAALSQRMNWAVGRTGLAKNSLNFVEATATAVSIVARRTPTLKAAKQVATNPALIGREAVRQSEGRRRKLAGITVSLDLVDQEIESAADFKFESADAAEVFAAKLKARVGSERYSEAVAYRRSRKAEGSESAFEALCDAAKSILPAWSRRSKSTRNKA